MKHRKNIFIAAGCLLVLVIICVVHFYQQSKKEISYTGKQLFENEKVEIEKVEQITYYAFDETEAYLTDHEVISSILNDIFDKTYIPNQDKMEFVEGAYMFELVMENGDTVEFDLDSNFLGIADMQYTCDEGIDAEQILQHFE